MRIRRSPTPTPKPTPTAPQPTPVFSPVSPCCSSSSSCTSTLSSHSLSSTTSSSSSSSSTPLSTTRHHRCEGLDLLVKAVYHVVAGSTVAVPYIQRRIIRRRKPALKFTNLLIPHDGDVHSAAAAADDDDDHGDVFDGSTKLSAVVMKMKMNIKRRSKGGSVLKSLKPGNQRKSLKKKTKIKLGN